MNFGSPLNAFWLLPVWVAITVLYLLRRPRRNVSVPSTLFWRSVPQESVRRAKIQRFTPQLLYFIQMLAALVIVMCLMQPKVRSHIAEGTPIAIVIDNGVTSTATDVSPTRFDAEKSAALSVLDQSEFSHSRITVVSTAPTTVEGGLGISVSQARSIIGNLEATNSSTTMPSSVSAASSALHAVAKFGQSPQIMIFSDMAWSSSQDTALNRAADGYSISSPAAKSFASGDTNDAAISRFAVQRDNVDPAKTVDLYAQISATSQLSGVRVIFSSVGMQPVTRFIDVSPAAPASISLHLNAPANATEINAKLEIPESFHDQIESDNSAYAILPPSGNSQILLVSSGDPGLSAALSILPGVSVTQISPDQYSQNGASDQFDAAIFDGVSPDPSKMLSCGELIWGGASPTFTPSTSESQWQQVADWDRSSQLLRFSDLSTTLLKAPSWHSVGGWSPVIETSNGIVAASSELVGQRKIWLSFLPNGSGFESSPAFPIFVSNCVTWLSQSASGESTIAGSPIVLPRSAKNWQVMFTDAAGNKSTSTYDGSSVAIPANLAGVYTASDGARELQFVRNCPDSAFDLASKSHAISGLEPKADLHAGSPHVHDWQPATGWAVAICIMIMLAEWILYHKPLQKAK